MELEKILKEYDNESYKPLENGMQFKDMATYFRMLNAEDYSYDYTILKTHLGDKAYFNMTTKFGNKIKSKYNLTEDDFDEDMIIVSQYIMEKEVEIVHRTQFYNYEN